MWGNVICDFNNTLFENANYNSFSLIIQNYRPFILKPLASVTFHTKSAIKSVYRNMLNTYGTWG